MSAVGMRKKFNILTVSPILKKNFKPVSFKCDLIALF